MKILGVSTSLSEDSTTRKLGDKILAAAASAGESLGLSIDTEQLNVRTLTSALTDMTLTGFRSEELEAAHRLVAEADAIVSVAPVYKAAPVGLHTLFWQLIDEKILQGTPVLIASTGGTPRHSLAAETALRPLLGYLKGIVVPTTVFAATEDWGSAEGGRDLVRRIEQAAEELVSLSVSLGGQGSAEAAGGGVRANGEFGRTGGRQRPGADDEFDPEFVTPFAQLLQG